MIKKSYILNNKHEFPFFYEEKNWIMYYPGYEGIYAISNDGYVLSLQRSILQIDGKIYPVKQRLLKCLLKGNKGRKTCITFNLYKEDSLGKPQTVTMKQILKIVTSFTELFKI